MNRRSGSIVVPLNGDYNFLDDLFDRGRLANGIKFYDISPDELLFITSDFCEDLFDATGILVGSHESDFIEGHEIGKLIAFCKNYQRQAPTLYEAALFAKEHGGLMMTNF